MENVDFAGLFGIDRVAERRVGRGCRAMERFMGMGSDDERLLPDSDRIKVRSFGWQLLASTVFSSATLFAGLTIGGTGWVRFLVAAAAVAVFAPVVASLDRRSVIDGWVDAGMKRLRERGFVPAPGLSTRLAGLASGCVRLTISIAIGLTTSAQLEAARTSDDAAAWITTADHRENSDLYRIVGQAAQDEQHRLDAVAARAEGLREQEEAQLRSASDPGDRAEILARATEEVESDRQRQRADDAAADAEERAAAVEVAGAKEPGASGQAGKGALAEMHLDAARIKRAAATRDAEDAERLEGRMRTLRASNPTGASSALSPSPTLSASVEAARRSEADAVRKADAFRSSTTAWIAERVLASPGYKDVGGGTLAHENAISAILLGSPWLMARAILMTLTIVCLDCAVILSKLTSPSPTCFGLLLAARLERATATLGASIERSRLDSLARLSMREAMRRQAAE